MKRLSFFVVVLLGSTTLSLKPSRFMWSEACNLSSLLFPLPSVYRVRARFSELMGEGRKDPMKTTVQISGSLPIYFLLANDIPFVISALQRH
jgi:hypothetical protein